LCNWCKKPEFAVGSDPKILLKKRESKQFGLVGETGSNPDRGVIVIHGGNKDGNAI